MGGIVLMYHRVVASSCDPLYMRVRPEYFQEHVARLQGLADVVPLPEIRVPGRNGRHRRHGRRVAITFDDGYRDNLTTAGPILSDAGMSATVFVTRGEAEPDRHFWWDRVEHLALDDLGGIEHLQLELGGQRLLIDVRTAAGRERAVVVINHRLLRASSEEVNELVEQLDDQTGAPGWPCELHDRLTDDDLRAMLPLGLAVGGHTRTHRMLSTLPPSEQRDEVQGCRSALERVVAAPVTTFAYPFGDRDAFTSDTVRAVRGAGYDLACTTSVGRVRARTRRYRIPRLGIYDWDGERFASEIERLFELGV